LRTGGRKEEQPKEKRQQAEELSDSFAGCGKKGREGKKSDTLLEKEIIKGGISRSGGITGEKGTITSWRQRKTTGPFIDRREKKKSGSGQRGRVKLHLKSSWTSWGGSNLVRKKEHLN